MQYLILKSIMKIFSGSLIITLFLILISACNGKGTVKKDSSTSVDSTSVPDTGYTGIKKYMSGQLLIKEVTFKNGVREGLMKSFYQDGRVRQTFTYHNGVRVDSAKWYYEDGLVFRSTPYTNDTIDGIQKQYYRNGRIKAKIGYKKGLRTPYIEEFAQNGKLIIGYSEIVVSIRDEYQTKGYYRIMLELSDKSKKVKYYRGDLSGGIFDTAHCRVINTINGIGYLNMKKTGSATSGSVGVIAEVLTSFGNNNLIYKKIELPYNDLK
jgi:hypothetical protein